MLALVVVALLLLAPLEARADGSNEPPGDTDRVITLGPQAVVDPEPARRSCACTTTRRNERRRADRRWRASGQVLGVYGVAAYLTLDNLTVIGFKGERVTPPRLGSPAE